MTGCWTRCWSGRGTRPGLRLTGEGSMLGELVKAVWRLSSPGTWAIVGAEKLVQVMRPGDIR